MKKLRLFRASLLLGYPKNVFLVLAWLEQFAAWFATGKVDWANLPWVVGGSTVAMIKARKNSDGTAVHKSFYDWLGIAAGGTLVGMAAHRDIINWLKLSDELCSVIAGLIGWWLADFILDKAKKQFADNSTTLKP